MPRLEDIEKFKEVLNTLGSEKEIREEKGEYIEDVEPPEQGLSEDLSNLLGLSDGAEIKTPPPTESVSTEEPPEEVPVGIDTTGEVPGFDLPDVAEMTDLTGDIPPEDLPSEPPLTEVEKDTGLSDLDILSSLQEQTPPPPEQAAPSPELSDLSDFEMPDISDIKEAPEAAVEPPLKEEPPLEPPKEEIKGEAEALPPDLDLGDISGFEMPDISDISEAGAEPPPKKEPQQEQIVPEQVPPTPEGGGEEFNIDEFALPEFGEEKFGLPEQEEAIPTPMAEIKAEEELKEVAATPELAHVEEEISLTKEEFERIQQTLSHLPRNLKIIIEEQIGEKELKGENLKKLLDLLIDRESPRKIAALVSTIIGKKIPIPKSFEKRTGIAYELERESFAYVFRHKILPALTFVSVGLFLVLALFLAINQFIINPLKALSLYDQGYDAIIARYDFATGNEKFNEARNLWEMKDQYYRFAQVFMEKGAYKEAENKYIDLLKRYPADEKGSTDYARFLTKRGRYAEVDGVLRDLLDKDMYNYKGLLAKADNYLQWATKDSDRYEDALLAYKLLQERYAGRDEVTLRLLNYYIQEEANTKAKNNFTTVQMYKDYLKKKGYNYIEPEIYTELAAYLIDKGQMDDVKDILDATIKENNKYPEAYYELSRYYNKIYQAQLEFMALKEAAKYFEEEVPLEESRIPKHIKTHNRLGEIYYEQGNPVQAEMELLFAKDLYEGAAEKLGPAQDFGKIYHNLGNIYYYDQQNYLVSRFMFEKADKIYNAANYKDANVKYKIGFTHYMEGDYENAMLRFYSAAALLPYNHNVLYAMANTLFQRKLYSAAQGHYIYLLGLLETERERIQFLRLEDNPAHRNLMQKMAIVYNNLGITYFMLGLNPKDDEKQNQALIELENAAEIIDMLGRDPDTMVRAQTVRGGTRRKGEEITTPPPYKNMDIIFHSKNIDELEVYTEESIPVDILQDNFKNEFIENRISGQ